MSYSNAGPSRLPSTGGGGGSSTPPTTKGVVVPLSYELISFLKPAKQFKDALSETTSTISGNPHNITSLSFDDTGDRLVSAGDDDTFVLWDCKKGKKIKTLYSKKYGIDHVRFTHKPGTILHASTKGDDHAIRYHSMHDNKYLAYFKGHTARVRSIHMSPIDDTFVTAGDDGTVRLWDLKSNSCKGLVKDVGGSAIATLDNTGLVFAVACSETQTIMLYATQTMDLAPFMYEPLNDVAFEKVSQPPPKPIFTSLQFSNNGDYLLVGTSSDVHYVLDSMSLKPLRRLVGHGGLERDRQGNKDVQPRRGVSGEELSWTADSNWVVSGSADGNVLFWDLTRPNGVDKLKRDDLKEGDGGERWYMKEIPEVQAKVLLRGNGAVSRAVRFNPRYNMMAVGGEDLTFWLPAKDEDVKMQEGW
ncbi:hypothetical protein CI109_102673 [Kwoniella shandongensis]|uniref:Uncharacterized protein n=1 Tax=Kwoniella shandongensis TaxID=1734106 RepID=A0A5M6BUR6_9TREE|nr:uncharacterized protein CI109_005253 [Kwoniella shandongensis]KAA5526483.1 hypothetical protein CI109_005253 [Kwoniella shandongensis]